MSEVVVIRPGRTDYDEQHRIAGSLDLPLNARGSEQVDRLAERLRHLGIEVVHTSAGDPAHATAERIATALDVPLRVHEELRSLDQGLWQGLEVNELRRKYGKVFKQWKDAPESVCPPQGEPTEDAVERVRRCLAKPLKRTERFAVVASEPLASIVRSVVSGGRLELPVCTGDVRHEILAEVVSVEPDGRVEVTPISVATAGAGAGSNGSGGSPPR